VYVFQQQNGNAFVKSLCFHLSNVYQCDWHSIDRIEVDQAQGAMKIRTSTYPNREAQLTADSKGGNLVLRATESHYHKSIDSYP